MTALLLPVLLDTNIGSDIDDVVALAYLLAQPRCELVGITTVSGEPHRRAALARALCRAAGRTRSPLLRPRNACQRQVTGPVTEKAARRICAGRPFRTHSC